jgi:hypothetical protein
MQDRPSKTDNSLIVFTLGPPTDLAQRAKFDSLQRDGFSMEHPWMKFESKIAAGFLFGHPGDGKSTVEDFYERLTSVPIRINDHTVGHSFQQRQWLASISIKASDVEGVPWPPHRKIAAQMGEAFGFILKREWIHWFAPVSYPVSTTKVSVTPQVAG